MRRRGLLLLTSVLAAPAALAQYPTKPIRMIVISAPAGSTDMLARMMAAQQQQVPIVNYGVAIAALQGILPRALSPFPQLVDLL